MQKPEIISFDVEGTLVSHDFSETLWHTAIPLRYSQVYDLSYEQAVAITSKKFEEVGSYDMTWYDVDYWFKRFKLGNSDEVLRSCFTRIKYFPEVETVLSSLAAHYKLIIASSVPIYMLDYLLMRIEKYFTRIFSATTQYGQLKTRYFYQQICREMKSNPENIVHVGDSYTKDYLNPREVGIQSVYLDRTNNNDSAIHTLNELKVMFLD